MKRDQEQENAEEHDLWQVKVNHQVVRTQRRPEQNGIPSPSGWLVPVVELGDLRIGRNPSQTLDVGGDYQ